MVYIHKILYFSIIWNRFFMQFVFLQKDLLCHTSCSHAVKNTSRSKEDTVNEPTYQTEQVTFGMKQSLRGQILSFFKKFKQILFCGSLMCCDRSL